MPIFSCKPHTIAVFIYHIYIYIYINKYYINVSEHIMHADKIIPYQHYKYMEQTSTPKL